MENQRGIPADSLDFRGFMGLSIFFANIWTHMDTYYIYNYIL